MLYASVPLCKLLGPLEVRVKTTEPTLSSPKCPTFSRLGTPTDLPNSRKWTTWGRRKARFSAAYYWGLCLRGSEHWASDEQTGASKGLRTAPLPWRDGSKRTSSAAGECPAWFPEDKACGHRQPLGSEARSTPPVHSTELPVPSRPGNARDEFACASRRTQNRSSSDSWDGGLVEVSWTEGYFSRSDGLC